MRACVSLLVLHLALALTGCDQKVAVAVAMGNVQALTSGVFSCSKWNPSVDAMTSLDLTDTHGLPSNSRGAAYFPAFFAAGNPDFDSADWGLLLTTEDAAATGAPLFHAFAVRLDATSGQIAELKELVNFVQPTVTRSVDVEALAGFYDASGKETLIVPNVGNDQPDHDDTKRSLLVVDLTPLKVYTDANASSIVLSANELALAFDASSYTDQDGHAWSMAATLPILDFTAFFTDGKYAYMVSRSVPGDGNDLKSLYLAPSLMFKAPLEQIAGGGNSVSFTLAGRLYPEIAALLYFIRGVTTGDKASALQTLNAYSDFVGLLPDADSRKASLNSFVGMLRDYVNNTAQPSLSGFLKANQGALTQLASDLRDGNDSGLQSGAGGQASASIKSLSDLYTSIAKQYGMTDQDASQAVAPALMPIVTDGLVVSGAFSGKQVDGASTAATARQLDLLTYGGQMFIAIDPQGKVPKLSEWIVKNLVQFVGTPADNTPQMEALFTATKPPQVVGLGGALDDGFDLTAGSGLPFITFFMSNAAQWLSSANPNSGICKGQNCQTLGLDDSDPFAIVRSFTCAN